MTPSVFDWLRRDPIGRGALLRQAASETPRRQSVFAARLCVGPEHFTRRRVLELHELEDWDGTPFELRRFVGHVMQDARRLGLPLYARAVRPSQAILTHTEGLQMGSHDCSELRALCRKVAERLELEAKAVVMPKGLALSATGEPVKRGLAVRCQPARLAGF